MEEAPGPNAPPSIKDILLSNAQLIKQGAEARIYITELYPSSDGQKGDKVLLKHRFKKAYRHPSLDAALTSRRITHEARILVRARKAGVLVPSLRFVDLESGIIGMTYIEGMTAREAISTNDNDDKDKETSLRSLFSDIGSAIGLLHSVDLVHGDLTTSNMILGKDGKVALIDFGLSTTSTLAEDKAVDLYVLERAFGSTHPALENRFSEILQAYAREYKHAKAVLSRLDEVRLRGRKRSMVG